ncbi:MAG TPA: type II toxin-antitoxin system HipA family toxin [Bacteroidales bacterium]|nr:type II toxin-antitoxin system HipA family toxin [Bacteroidales bacterium]
MVDYAIIKIWGETVGAVRWDESQQLAFFEYERNFISKDWDLSPLKMPLAFGPRIYSFPELRKGKNATTDTFKGLPALLADSLPDKYGNQLINIWLAQQGRPENSMNPVEQLCFIGTRGMGALEFETALFKDGKRASTLEISSLVDIAQRMLNQRELFLTNLPNNEEKAVAEILKIGTSAGGARPKALIAYNPQTGVVKSGQGNAPEGFEHWLIKLDGVSDAQFGESTGWGSVEYAYYLMAKASGIDMTECRLFKENGRAHFMTRRFDREDNAKHHIQTLCAIQHYNYNEMFAYSYEQVFQTMRLLRLTYPEAEQMFRRMVFNVLATNCDDHTKNISFRFKKGNRWELAPAYDICFAYDPTNVWVNQQTLSVNGKRSSIIKEDFMTIAKANNIKKGEEIIEAINQTVCHWADFAKQANVDEKLLEHIQRNLHTLNKA